MKKIYGKALILIGAILFSGGASADPVHLTEEAQKAMEKRMEAISVMIEHLKKEKAKNEQTQNEEERKRIGKILDDAIADQRAQLAGLRDAYLADGRRIAAAREPAGEPGTMGSAGIAAGNAPQAPSAGTAAVPASESQSLQQKGTPGYAGSYLTDGAGSAYRFYGGDYYYASDDAGENRLFRFSDGKMNFDGNPKGNPLTGREITRYPISDSSHALAPQLADLSSAPVSIRQPRRVVPRR